MSYSPYSRPRQNQSSNNALWIIVLLFGLWFVYQNQNPVVPDPDNQQEQTEPSDDPVDLEGCWIVMVEETQNRPTARQLILDNDQFWREELPNKKMQFRRFDPDSQAARTFVEVARKNSISHPFVMLVDDHGKVLELMPFPATIDPIKEWVK